VIAGLLRFARNDGMMNRFARNDGMMNRFVCNIGHIVFLA
jgi:hypothetical protein